MHFLPLSHPILTFLTLTHNPAVTSAWPVDARHHGNCSFHSNRADICRLCQNLLLDLSPCLSITLSFFLLSSLCITYLILGCWNTQTYPSLMSTTTPVVELLAAGTHQLTENVCAHLCVCVCVCPECTLKRPLVITRSLKRLSRKASWFQVQG